MKKKSVLLSALMALFTVSGAFATNGMRLIGFGPVQDSMAGASVGANLDAASVLTNPAGIQGLGGRVDFGSSYFNPVVEMKIGGTKYESDKGASPIPAFGLAIPLNDSTSFGLGAYGVSGMGVDYNMGAMGILYTSYSMMRFAPGLSYKLNDMITVGATLNLMYAQMEYAMNMGGNEYVNMGASSFGYGATIGVTMKPIDMITIGLAYETTSKFQDFKFNQYSSGGTVMENKLTFDQPMNATIGFGLKPVDDLVIAFDVQWIKWSETNGDDLPEYTAPMDGNFDMQWEDQIVYKLGIQYQVIPALVLRAGVNYGKMPVSESNNNALQANMFFPAIAEWHYTVGAGVNFNDKLALNLGYMYAPETKVDVSMGGEAKMYQYAYDMGIAYKF